MSHDVHLVDPVTKTTLEVDQPHQMRGGITDAYGGTTELSLNVTYNYGKILHRVLTAAAGQPTSLMALYGKTGAETIPIFKAAIAMLKDDVHPDYWEPTEGNVKQALCHLLAMAQMRPDGVWEGD